MEFHVLGIGDAFTSHHYNTSFLLRKRHQYLIDGPHSLLRLLRERKIDAAQIDRVIITHVHGDHTAGLQTLLLWRHAVGAGPLRLYTSASVFKELQEKFFPAFSRTFSSDLHQIVPSNSEKFVQFCEISSERSNDLEEGLFLEIRENWHPTPTLGLKFISAQEGSVSISGDTCFRPALLKELLEAGIIGPERYQRLAGSWLWESDVVYHEATRREHSSHTLEQDLLDLPASWRSRIRLVHLPDDFQEGALRLAREGERVVFSQGVPARTILPGT